MPDNTSYRILYISLSALGNMNAQTIHAGEICNHLRAMGHVVDLVSLPSSGKRGAAGLAVTLLRQVWVQLSLSPRIRKYDLIYLRGHPSAFVVCALAGLLRIPVIYEVNGPPADAIAAYPQLRWARAVLERMQRFQYGSSSAIVAVTEGLAKQVRAIAPAVPVEVVSNAGNPEIFRPADKRDGRKPYVVFVGSLAPWHDLETAVKATADPDWPRDVELVVIGEGAGTRSLRQMQADADKMRYLGALARDKVAEILSGAAAGLVLISNPLNRSTTGVMPLKLFDAMACGVPVIATDLPGQAELVREYACGYVVPVGDAPAVAKAVRALWSDAGSAAEMGARGHAAILAGHSWSHRARDIHELISRLVPTKLLKNK